MRGRILIVEDELEMCRLLESQLGRVGFAVTARTSAADALSFLESEELDAIVTDLQMRGMSGLELCARVASNRPDVPVVVITAFGSMEKAIGAIRAGAYDFLTKPFDVDHLALALDRAVQHRRLHEEVRRLRHVVAAAGGGAEELIGKSAAMRRVHDIVRRLAGSDASVLITGETGTGKELVARALHRSGRRRDGPFLAINCAALPESLLESQLFGHVRGAFTDAHEARVGLLVLASGGTLLLDEIGEMPLGLQPKILRALQERAVRPVGATVEVPFDVRIIAATNREIEETLEEGRLRRDLYFRINVVQIHVPPLRERGNDVLLLAQHFLEEQAARAGKRVTAISAGAAERLVHYYWPGNVRELQNCIERAVALTAFDQILVDDLPEQIRSHRPLRPVVAGDEEQDGLLPLGEIEKRHILRVLEAAGGNKTLAAQLLGVDRRTLYRKLERYES